MRSCPCKPFVLPHDRAKFLSEFLPARQAARALGLSYRHTLHFMHDHPDLCAQVRVKRATGEVVWLHCLVVRELRTWAADQQPPFLPKIRRTEGFRL